MKCDHCNSMIFEVIPFKTTQKEIVEFAQKSSLKHKESIIASKWMYPGLHCPNGCTVLHRILRIELPAITRDEALAIAQQFSLKHHSEFIETHGARSRIVACIHCKNFKGAVLEGWDNNHVYRNPKFKPLCNHIAVRVSCLIPKFLRHKGAWWYDKGKDHPECDFFSYNRMFKYVYKDVTGWSEYPEE